MILNRQGAKVAKKEISGPAPHNAGSEYAHR